MWYVSVSLHGVYGRKTRSMAFMAGVLIGLLKREPRVIFSQHIGVASPQRHNKTAGFCLGNVCESGSIVRNLCDT